VNGHVLVVDDEQSMCELLQADLTKRGLSVAWHTSAEAGLRAIHARDYDVVLTDIKMPGTTGLQLCEQVSANRPDVPVVVMTAFGSLETAIGAIRAGAYDFVTKPVEMDLLEVTLRRAIQHHQLQDQVKRLREQLAAGGDHGEMVGESPSMLLLYDQLHRVADSEASILITGESGTGKELVARSIHQRSRRARAPFVAVNCAALPEALLESELFGHAKGAFTDARTERKGLFQEAEGGTLFLDEVGELPLAMQAKLLRALEENKVRPIGSNREVTVDARLLTATNRDLDCAVEEKRFREDLYYRINVIQIELPPLRSRGTDVLLIARRFVEHFAGRAKKDVKGISDQAATKLLAYAWPGNVRELRNVIERAVALTRYEKLAVDDLPDKVRDYQSSQLYLGGSDPTELVSMEEVERRYIAHVLQSVGGNKTLAARILGLDRKTLYRKLSDPAEE
jgi:two-component system response regulator HydG